MLPRSSCRLPEPSLRGSELLGSASVVRRPLICATSSFGGVTYLFTTAYGVGKTGTDRLMRDLQVELGPLGVDCVSLWPGIVLTEEALRVSLSSSRDSRRAL